MTTYRPPTKQPCSDCPFRRASMPGWLGAGSPESFIDCMQRDEPLPCHQTIDYDDPAWLEKWSAQETGSMCAGALIFMANKAQRPRNREFPTMPPDKVGVFSNSVEFVRHHREASTHSWDDDGQNDGARLHRELVKRAAEASGQPIVDRKHSVTGRALKPPPMQPIPPGARVLTMELSEDSIARRMAAIATAAPKKSKKGKRPYARRSKRRRAER